MSEQEENNFLNQQTEPTQSDLTAVHLAAQANDLRALLEAIGQGVDVNSLTDDGWTALHFAAYKGFEDIVKALIKAGVNIDIQGKIYNRTALHYAVHQDNLAIVKIILAYNPDLSLTDKGGETVLDIANRNGFVAVAAELNNFLARH